MKTFGIIVLAVILLSVGAIWSTRSRVQSDPNIIATDGIHAHPTLEIYVRGQKIEIPQNIGLIGTHSPVHTHDDLPIIHLEFSGIVRRSDIQLGKFFDVWGKDFYEFGQNVTMTVNGVPNTQYANYEMQHEDAIVLSYE